MKIEFPVDAQRAASADVFSRELLAALLCLRDGDFTVRLPSDLTGVNGKIADAFNDIAAVTARRARETSRVSRVVGKEGKLKQRMSVPGAVGGWADEVAAINMLIDDLVWPTTEVTRAVGAVAKGDLGQAMALEVDGRPLEGEFLRSAKLVNKMIDQLSVFTSEVTRVAREVGTKRISAGVLRSKVGVFIDLFRKTQELAAVNDALQSEIAAREKAQDGLRQANLELERRVHDRTVALNRAHQGVRENEERLRMALEVAQLAAWEWHLASSQMRWSTDPEVVFGFPKGAFGQELRLLRTIHSDDRARVEEATAVALKTGLYEAEYRAVRPDGSIAWITERGRVFSDVDGDRMVGISRDITAERSAIQERERLLKNERDARDEAERQSRLKDEFLANLSHELRTPMNAILGWLSILESGKPVREVHSALEVIGRNAQIQARLINDLLDMNRLISATVTLDVGTVDLPGLLQTTMQSLQPAADAKGVQLIATVQSNVGTISGDGRRLQQVLWNLVHNAVKFSKSGGRVEIHVQSDDGRLELTVRDNGQGISPTFLPHVFERFRQQDASSTRSAAGLGLGLSIAKHLVELHGGDISARSAGDGQGAAFTVTLPAGSIHGGDQERRRKEISPDQNALA